MQILQEQISAFHGGSASAPTTTDGGSAGFASLHGKNCSYNSIAFPPSMEVRCNLVGQCICPGKDGSRVTHGAVTEVLLPICPWMDGSRAMQEQLPICPWMDGSRAMQELLPRSKKTALRLTVSARCFGSCLGIVFLGQLWGRSLFINNLERYI